jgi:hypothetical protein
MSDAGKLIDRLIEIADQLTEDDLAKLANLLTKGARGKARAIKRIRAEEDQGSSGRPAKSEYFDADLQVLFQVELYEGLFRSLGRDPPKKRSKVIREAIAQAREAGGKLGSDTAAFRRITRTASLNEMSRKTGKSSFADREALRRLWEKLQLPDDAPILKAVAAIKALRVIIPESPPGEFSPAQKNNITRQSFCSVGKRVS